MFDTRKLQENIVKYQDPELLLEEVEKEGLLRDILDISEEDMKGFYSTAKTLFDENNYQDAADAFMALVTLDGMVPQYWLGLGASELYRREYASAQECLAMAANFDFDDPLLHIYAAELGIKTNDKELVSESLDIVEEIIGDKKEDSFDAIRKVVRNMRQWLKSSK